MAPAYCFEFRCTEWGYVLIAVAADTECQHAKQSVLQNKMNGFLIEPLTKYKKCKQRWTLSSGQICLCLWQQKEEEEEEEEERQP